MKNRHEVIMTDYPTQACIISPVGELSERSIMRTQMPYHISEATCQWRRSNNSLLTQSGAGAPMPNGDITLAPFSAKDDDSAIQHALFRASATLSLIEPFSHFFSLRDLMRHF